MRHGCTLSDKKERDFWQRMPGVSFFNRKWHRAGIGVPRPNVVAGRREPKGGGTDEDVAEEEAKNAFVPDSVLCAAFGRMLPAGF